MKNKTLSKEMTFVDYAITIAVVKDMRERIIDAIQADKQENLPCSKYIIGMFDDALIDLTTGLKKHNSDMVGNILADIEGF